MSNGTLVVGLDGSPGAAAALEVAIALARGLDLDLVAVHAFEPLALVGELPPPVDFTALREEVRAELEGPWTDAVRAAGLPCRAQLVEDKPVNALVRAAHDTSAVHVVVGTRGRGGVKGLLLGSVAQALPAALHVPVTIVPPPA
jgi:nucleotide-binding universal stress UspA family protein